MAAQPEALRKKFPWGFPIEDMEIGPYIVRAFHPQKYEGGRGTGKATGNERLDQNLIYFVTAN